MSDLACNIGSTGSRRRRLIGYVIVAFTFAALVAMLVLRSPWYARFALALPMAGGATSWLQSRRGTCVGHAMAGTVEAEDFRISRAAPDAAAASRRVAFGIIRDGLLVGLAFGALAALMF